MTAKHIILALGSEFDTRLALYINNKIYFSENTNEIAENPQNLEKFILNFLKKHRSTPTLIISDLHPLYNSTQIGEKLLKKWKIPHYKLQHHLAHIFTASGEYFMNHHPECKNIIGIACDGTGYGWDNKIWGGEVFSIDIPSRTEHPALWSNRIGHLEEQVLIGSNLSVAEPARMLISLLARIYPKNDIFDFVKHYYSKKDFEVIYSQLSQNFNCQPTTSTGRILDAVSILLGFCENKRKYKHYAAKKLEENSLPTYKSLAPKIQNTNSDTKILKTTNLIKYIANNLQGNKKEIAALAQIYIINGLYKIAKKLHKKKNNLPIFFSGGFAKNKIMKEFAEKNKMYIPQKISPGDEGIAAGQIFWYLLTDSRNQSAMRNIQLLFP